MVPQRRFVRSLPYPCSNLKTRTNADKPSAPDKHPARRPAWNRGLRAMSRTCPAGSPMEITQQIRDFAKEKGLDTEEAVEAGLLEKSNEFLDAGGEIYSEA